MESISTLSTFNEVIINTFESLSSTLRFILSSPLGFIILFLFALVIPIKLFRALFYGGYNYSYNIDDTDDIDDIDDTDYFEDTEEEIILDDDLIQQELKCHNCGAKLNVKNVKNSIIECEYCNTQYFVRNED